jgi:hypothetical protein
MERQRDGLGEAVIQFNIVFEMRPAGRLVQAGPQSEADVPDNDTLGERIKLYVVENFPDA